MKLMEPTYSYLLINVLAIFFPLILSFDKRVAFYKKWRYLYPAILIPAIIFILWDIAFTAMGIWGFNERYLTGINVVNLPLEEVLFFITIPYACVFTYEVIKVYFPGFIPGRRTTGYIYSVLALLLLLTTLIPHWRNYTDITFILLSAWLVYLLIKKEYPVMQHFLPAYGIIFFPFLIVNGALTGTGFEEPIVWYNNTEILSIRLLTIPVEDIFYGMLLILANVYIFEKLQSAHEKT